MIDLLRTLLMVTGVRDQDRPIPQSFKLYQNRPNPFRASTSIQIDVSTSAQNTPTSVKIYNILGQEVAALFTGQLTTGSHSFPWQGLDRNGSRVPGGVYFYVLESGRIRETRKLLYLGN